MRETRVIHHGDVEQFRVIIDTIDDMTMATIIWQADNIGNPLMGWIGIAHRNPVDRPNAYLGKALAFYRAIQATHADVAGTILRDIEYQDLFDIGQDYTLNGYQE